MLSCTSNPRISEAQGAVVFPAVYFFPYERASPQRESHVLGRDV
jgi:hypothetical protein